MKRPEYLNPGRRILAVTLVTALLALCSCAQETDIEDQTVTDTSADASADTSADASEDASEELLSLPDPDIPGAGKWVDSDITGSVSADVAISEKDDFAAAVNQDWICEQTYEDDAFSEIARTVYENKNALLEDSSLDSKEAEELIKFADLATDWDNRDEDGAEPLRKYMEGIDSIETVEDLLSWQNDPGRNPLGFALIMRQSVDRSNSHPDSYCIFLDAPHPVLPNYDDYFMFSLDSLEAKNDHEEKMRLIFTKLGYSDKEVKKLCSDAYRIERKILVYSDPKEAYDMTENDLSLPELIEPAGDYPLRDYLSARDLDRIDRYAADMRYVKNLHKLLKAKYLPYIKAWLKVLYAEECAAYLDSEIYDEASRLDNESLTEDYVEDNTIPGYEEEMLLYDLYIGQTAMSAAMDKLYVERYFSESEIAKIEETVNEIKNEYRDMLMHEDWLSDEGRKLSAAKLDALCIHVARPNLEIVSFEDLDIKSREEGGSFLEAFMECSRFKERQNPIRFDRAYDRTFWDPYDTDMSTTVTNAFYYINMNTVYIFAGILAEPLYSQGMDEEEVLGGIGTTIGHEITHGFDKDGALYDKEGLDNEWLPEDDLMEFNDRSDMVADYYSLIAPFENSGLYNGYNVNAEATADMGGLAVALGVASHKDDFDYDSFFRSYARSYRTQTSPETETYMLDNDTHPLNYLRVNVGVQQFDEFVDTYDIKPGDGMYLDPDERITVW
ncbi:MAG: M13 family metallopeptidase [Lachnospiraceae bacterium]|nr:M13 family metallopeptidase [Lachnospiraceae bacterium]